MTVQRTMVAVCDRPRCRNTIHLDPGDPQPHRTIVSAGWSLVNADDILTICPTHTREGTL